jgi:hypothetical protein
LRAAGEVGVDTVAGVEVDTPAVSVVALIWAADSAALIWVAALAGAI